MTKMGTKNRKTLLNRLILVHTVLLLAACSTNVFVKGDYPTPLGKPIPYHVGMVFDDNFKDHTFTRDNIEIKLGDAQTRMYTTLLNGMFANSTLLKSRETPPPEVDLFIVPNVEEIQIATPADNRLKVYEVWIKYNMQMFDRDGNSVADWLMTCYGKTPTATLKSRAKALNLASIVALRDAGARMATGFVRVPEVQGWLIRQTTKSGNDDPAFKQPAPEETTFDNQTLDKQALEQSAAINTVEGTS